MRLLALLPATGLLLTGACTSGSEPAEPAAAADAPSGRVIQPGQPGEPASEVESRSLEPGSTPAADESWNHADVMFMQMMIPHHAQALEMSRLADKHAQDPRVRKLAERIHAAQGPEIRVMSDWLADRDLEVPRADEPADKHDHAKHGHAGMTGMLTQAEMKRLAAARGARFDRLFLRGMIKHHRGAITMVDEITPDGEDVIVSEMAADMATGQAAEINRMNDVLTSLTS